jgi:uncharacterized protein (TIGR00299 family) protein
MRIAYFDCFSGASGDMILGACVAAGASAEALREGLAALRLDGYTLRVEAVRKQGFGATQVCVELNAPVAQPHRQLADIQRIIESSGLADETQSRSLAVFRRLAEAEAEAHGVPVEQIHFHEVGAVDAIVDVVGACIALDLLGVEEVRCSPIPPGSGTVECAHGAMPVPAPGTAALLRGVPIAACDEPGELTTPTGAAILTTLAAQYGPLPSMTVEAVGYGAGQRDGVTRPNLLRLFVGPTGTVHETDEVVVLEANLDDSTPESMGYVLEKAFEAGALDAFFTPIYMKKNRPAVQITVLAESAQVAAIEAILFAETTTFGVRRHRTARTKLTRTLVLVETAYGPVNVKIGRHGDRIVTVAPEFEDCRAAAARAAVPLRTVMDAAVRAFPGGH